MDDREEFVTAHTTKPLYSYWTLGYLISERGARKLLDAKPLDNMLPVDEFLPIMFDQHPKYVGAEYNIQFLLFHHHSAFTCKLLDKNLSLEILAR